jgi:hypothetical protein
VDQLVTGQVVDHTARVDRRDDRVHPEVPAPSRAISSARAGVSRRTACSRYATSYCSNRRDAEQQLDQRAAASRTRRHGWSIRITSRSITPAAVRAMRTTEPSARPLTVVLDEDAGRSGGGQGVPRDRATEPLVDTRQQGHRQHSHSRLIENDNQYKVPSEPE